MKQIYHKRSDGKVVRDILNPNEKRKMETSLGIYRDSVGRYAGRLSANKKTMKTIKKKKGGFVNKLVVVSFLVLIATAFVASKNSTQTYEVVGLNTAKAELTPDKLAEKIVELKQNVLDELSLNCEAKGISEPDGIIILDTNNKMSLGRFQFQITTVQHYVKKFESRDITRREAIEIAIDPERATPLAEKIIFEEGGLKSNWTNCTNRLQLEKDVEIINKLSD